MTLNRPHCGQNSFVVDATRFELLLDHAPTLRGEHQ
jgi:hypothetical protein